MIYATSDLHYGISPIGDEAVRALASGLSGARPDDVLLVGGDISVDDEGIAECLELFRDFPGHKLAIAGNHDVWMVSDDARDDSWKRYCRLPSIFSSAGFHPLEEEPIVIGGVGFAGSMGWYDGTFRDHDIGVPDEAYVAMIYPETGAKWSDVDFVRWSYSDREITEFLVERLAEQLERLTTVPEIVVLLHHLPTKRLLVHPRSTVPREWRFLNAFLGSERFGELLERHDRVRQVFCGHLHLRRAARLGRIDVDTVGSGYERKILLAYDGRQITARTFEAGCIET